MSKLPLTQSRYQVEGMDCASCALKIETAVRRLPGVVNIKVSATTGSMSVEHGNETSPQEIQKKVKALGYGIKPLKTESAAYDDHEHADGHDHGKGHSHDHFSHHSHGDEDTAGSWWQSRKGRLTLASGFALIAAYGLAALMPEFKNWIYIVAMAIGIIPVARRAVMAGLNGSPFSIETLMVIGAGGAAIIGASEEAAMVVFLFLVGEMLEGLASRKARDSIKSLTDLLPKTALREDGDSLKEVPADSLAVGDIIHVRPGDRIPSDGLILSGITSVDEAPVTGESTPKTKNVGERVFAGTVNLEAVIRIEVSAAAADNTISRVVALVEEAQEAKAPTERFIDSFSRYYTPFVLVLGTLVAVVPPLAMGGAWQEWIYKGLAILLIGCPCALVISTPAAIAAGLASGARRGLLLKGGVVLEKLAKLTTVAFDKTGTLTEGRPQVTDIIGVDRKESEVIRLVAALEAGSNHPLARAILQKADDMKIKAKPATDVKAIVGKGIKGNVDGAKLFFAAAQAVTVNMDAKLKERIAKLNGEGKTVSVLVMDDEIAGLVAMRDEPRADAVSGIRSLKQLGIKTLMLTGDNALTAKAIAANLGMEARAELLPEDKLKVVNELKAAGEVVGKCGDGINDAPAIAAADVGIAMGGGTDVALETSDAAVLHGRVQDVAEMVMLARRTMSNIHQNITLALGLKGVFLVTTLVGITGLWPAILADTGATVLVTINALRLLKNKNMR